MPSEEEFRRLAKQELNYDAWGRLRDPATHALYAQGSEPALFLGRGYTGHEHLTWFGLVNMNFAVEREQDEKSIFSIMPSVSKEGEANARLYDPVLGRFLSPDPYVQAPDNTQNYNRYSYALNNPLAYVDEDGEWIHLLIGAIFGGVSNLIANWNSVENFWQGLGYFGIGALAGAASAGIGAGVSSALAGGSFGAGFIGSAAAKTATTSFLTSAAISGSSSATNGFLTGLGNGLMNGNNFIQSFCSGIKNSFIDGISGAVGAVTHNGMHNLFDESGNIFSFLEAWGILPKNTTSYIISSTAAQATNNILKGKNPFENNNFGLNIGLVVPLFADAISANKAISLKMAKKHNTENVKDYEIYKIKKFWGSPFIETKMDSTGDLYLDVRVTGKRITPYGSNWANKLAKMIPSDLTDKSWDVNILLVRNYRDMIFNFFSIIK